MSVFWMTTEVGRFFIVSQYFSLLFSWKTLNYVLIHYFPFGFFARFHTSVASVLIFVLVLLVFGKY